MDAWVGIVVTAALTVVGLYYANSLRRRTNAEVEKGVAEKRFSSYAALWAPLKLASPMRDSPLTRLERESLFDSLTDWYYKDGNGMLLTEQTRNIYLNAKRNLTCVDDRLVPAALAKRVAEKPAEGD